MLMRKMPRHKVAEIRTQRRAGRWTVILDNGRVFGISEDVFISRPLHEGDFLSDEEIEEYVNADSRSRIKEAAYRLLGFRMRSKNEMKRRLMEKGFPREMVDPLIDELESKGYLNDREFALAFARDKIRSRSLGPVALRSELSVHRLDPEIIRDTIKTVYEEFPVEKLLNRLLSKRKIMPDTKLSPKEKKRVFNFLRRKGFTNDLIMKILNKHPVG